MKTIATTLGTITLILVAILGLVNSELRAPCRGAYCLNMDLRNRDYCGGRGHFKRGGHRFGRAWRTGYYLRGIWQPSGIYPMCPRGQVYDVTIDDCVPEQDVR